MKSKVMVLFLVLLGITAFAWAQGGSAAKGKTLVDSKKCALCHKAPEPGKPVQGKPMEMLAGGTDAHIKGAITDPKKTLGPQIKMPAFKLNDEQIKDITAYLRSIAKH